jgi:hypothetical protein
MNVKPTSSRSSAFEISVATAYLEYDGNRHTVQPSKRLLALAGRTCRQHPPGEVGDPFFGDA